MEYLLYNTTADLKKYVGGIVNESLAMPAISPFLDNVAETELIPLLGNTLWEELLVVETVNPATPIGKLFRHAATALGFLAMFDYIQAGTVQVGNSGMFRMETEEAKTAYRYQENSYRDMCQRMGYESLERMLLFLDKNEASFASWSAEGKKQTRQYVINYAAEMRQAYSKNIARYTFEAMRSLLGDLELFVLVPTMGRDQYNELKNAIITATFTAPLTSLLEIVQRTMAHFLVEESMRRNMVALQGHEVVQYIQTDNNRPYTPAPANASQMKINQAEEFAQRWLSYLICHLDDNIADYPLYEAWKETNAPAEDETDQRSVYPELWPGSNTANAVVRL